MKLSLGVIDFPYQEEESTPKATKGPRKKARRPVKVSLQSTGDVAEILEGKYGVMASFVDLHGEDIVSALENSMEGQLEGLLMGGPLSANVFAGAESVIENEFRQFLDREEMAQVAGIAGHAESVPTQAALKGVNHRLKRKRGARRPSFIDTGQYQASFKVEFNE